jgi:hypothetical protein
LVSSDMLEATIVLPTAKPESGATARCGDYSGNDGAVEIAHS